MPNCRLAIGHGESLDIPDVLVARVLLGADRVPKILSARHGPYDHAVDVLLAQANNQLSFRQLLNRASCTADIVPALIRSLIASRACISHWLSSRATR
jgi:hypothetical protein